MGSQISSSGRKWVLLVWGISVVSVLVFRDQAHLALIGRSHWVEEQSAVLSLCSSEDIWEWRQRALRQGTTSPQVAGDNLLVQAQLGGDALKRLRIEIQDGHRVGESRRSGGNEVPKSPLTGETEGGERRRVTGQEEQSLFWTSGAADWTSNLSPAERMLTSRFFLLSHINIWTKLLPFVILLVLTPGHQCNHDGAVLRCHGNAVLMDLKSEYSWSISAELVHTYHSYTCRYLIQQTCTKCSFIKIILFVFYYISIFPPRFIYSSVLVKNLQQSELKLLTHRIPPWWRRTPQSRRPRLDISAASPGSPRCRDHLSEDEFWHRHTVSASETLECRLLSLIRKFYYSFTLVLFVLPLLGEVMKVLFHSTVQRVKSFDVQRVQLLSLKDSEQNTVTG